MLAHHFGARLRSLVLTAGGFLLAGVSKTSARDTSPPRDAARAGEQTPQLKHTAGRQLLHVQELLPGASERAAPGAHVGEPKPHPEPVEDPCAGPAQSSSSEGFGGALRDRAWPGLCAGHHQCGGLSSVPVAGVVTCWPPRPSPNMTLLLRFPGRPVLLRAGWMAGRSVDSILRKHLSAVTTRPGTGRAWLCVFT